MKLPGLRPLANAHISPRRSANSPADGTVRSFAVASEPPGRARRRRQPVQHDVVKLHDHVAIEVSSVPGIDPLHDLVKIRDHPLAIVLRPAARAQQLLRASIRGIGASQPGRSDRLAHQRLRGQRPQEAGLNPRGIALQVDVVQRSQQ